MASLNAFHGSGNVACRVSSESTVEDLVRLEARVSFEEGRRLIREAELHHLLSRLEKKRIPWQSVPSAFGSKDDLSIALAVGSSELGDPAETMKHVGALEELASGQFAITMLSLRRGDAGKDRWSPGAAVLATGANGHGVCARGLETIVRLRAAVMATGSKAQLTGMWVFPNFSICEVAVGAEVRPTLSLELAKGGRTELVCETSESVLLRLQ